MVLPRLVLVMLMTNVLPAPRCLVTEEMILSPGCTVSFSSDVCQEPSVQSNTPLKMV